MYKMKRKKTNFQTKFLVHVSLLLPLKCILYMPSTVCVHSLFQKGGLIELIAPLVTKIWEMNGNLGVQHAMAVGTINFPLSIQKLESMP